MRVNFQTWAETFHRIIIFLVLLTLTNWQQLTAHILTAHTSLSVRLVVFPLSPLPSLTLQTVHTWARREGKGRVVQISPPVTARTGLGLVAAVRTLRGYEICIISTKGLGEIKQAGYLQ